MKNDFFSALASACAFFTLYTKMCFLRAEICIIEKRIILSIASAVYVR